MIMKNIQLNESERLPNQWFILYFLLCEFKRNIARHLLQESGPKDKPDTEGQLYQPCCTWVWVYTKLIWEWMWWITSERVHLVKKNLHSAVQYCTYIHLSERFVVQYTYNMSKYMCLLCTTCMWWDIVDNMYCRQPCKMNIQNQNSFFIP